LHRERPILEAQRAALDDGPGRIPGDGRAAPRRHALLPGQAPAAPAAALLVGGARRRSDRLRSDCTIEAPTFVRVLDRAGLRAGPLRVIAFEAMYAAGQTSCFSRELAKLAGPGARLPRWIAELRVIEPALDASDYYPLDEHLKASGYRKIARAIAGAMAD